MRVFGLIPARGGSKGVRRKALREVGGVTLLERAVASAQKSRLDALYVTTDDEEIASVAKRLGADVLMRPEALAQDATPMVPVVRHAWESIGVEYGAVFLLQPTTPFRTSADIDEGLRLLEQPGIDAVVGVVRVEDAHPARMYRRDAGGWLVALDPANEFVNRQELEPLYHRNGAAYACPRATLTRYARLVGGRVAPLEMPRLRSINIDDEDDLAIADAIARSLGR